MLAVTPSVIFPPRTFAWHKFHHLLYSMKLNIYGSPFLSNNSLWKISPNIYIPLLCISQKKQIFPKLGFPSLREAQMLRIEGLGHRRPSAVQGPQRPELEKPKFPHLPTIHAITKQYTRNIIAWKHLVLHKSYNIYFCSLKKRKQMVKHSKTKDSFSLFPTCFSFIS